MEKSTQKLIDELTNKLIISLNDNEALCPTCKGLRFILEQRGKQAYIESCPDCYNGKVYVCKHCGKHNKSNYCNCDGARKERNAEFNKKQQEKEQKLFGKAKKIKFNDYNGYFFIPDYEGRVYDGDAVYDWLCDKIKYDKLSNEELPSYLWSTSPEPVFDMDLKDILYDKCEEGYEDMDSFLNTDDEDFKLAQQHLDKWYKKQGDAVNTYYENYDIAILLDDVITEIKYRIRMGEL
ncbi:hypothetical protein ACFHWD_04295 [Clostridium sp. MT-14]|uniref:hypothetical protein n=1 Tax=Clostridium sp. MT-14 TaxID=3348360 RepID=UPI0035F47CCB